MKRVFRLVPQEESFDTQQALEHLLHDARSGELIGLAYAAMYRRREYMVSATGEAHRNPTFALGMVAMLDEELRCFADSKYGQ